MSSGTVVVYFLGIEAGIVLFYASFEGFIILVAGRCPSDLGQGKQAGEVLDINVFDILWYGGPLVGLHSQEVALFFRGKSFSGIVLVYILKSGCVAVGEVCQQAIVAVGLANVEVKAAAGSGYSWEAMFGRLLYGTASDP